MPRSDSQRLLLCGLPLIARLAGCSFWLALLAGGMVGLWRLAVHIAAAQQIHVVGTALALCLLMAANYLGLYGLLWTARYSAWLSGSVLSVRGAFTTRAADLAVSTVRGEIRPGHPRHRPTVHLVARDTATGRKVDLRLGTVDHIELTPPQMDALSDAVAQGTRQPGTGSNNLLLAERLRLFYRRPAPVARYLWADPA